MLTPEEEVEGEVLGVVDGVVEGVAVTEELDEALADAELLSATLACSAKSYDSWQASVPVIANKTNSQIIK